MTQVIRISDNEAIEIQGERGDAARLESYGLKSADPDDRRYNAAIDGLERLVLALHGAGLDVGSEQFVEGVRTAYSAIVDQF